MKFSLAFTSLLVATASARPEPKFSTRQTGSLPDDPSPVPVDVLNLDHDISSKCGSTTFKYSDIYEAIQWGILLQNAGVRRGKKSNEFPIGRFPHSYTATDFDFGGDCPADDSRQEYPLILNGPYNGGLRNDKWGQHRAVYYYEEGEIGGNNPVGYFCGLITHEGSEDPSKFVQCS